MNVNRVETVMVLLPTDVNTGAWFAGALGVIQLPSAWQVWPAGHPQK